MRSSFVAVLAFVVTLAASGSALAQADPWRMPWQGGFWGHAGISYGVAQLDVTCPPNTGCDDSEQGLRIFGGGRFNNTFGAEIGFVRLGDFNLGGGETDAQAVDLAFTAGIPFGNNWSVFAKVGAAYTRTEVTSTTPGLQAGNADGWGPRYGLGLEAGITQNWAVRADWDRYRFKFPAGRENIDTLMFGVKYSFR